MFWAGERGGAPRRLGGLVGRAAAGPAAELKPTLVVVTHDVDEAIVLGDRVVVMRPRPGRVGEELPIALPRPRDRQSPAFDFAKRPVLTALDRAQDRPLSVDDREAETAAGAALWW